MVANLKGQGKTMKATAKITVLLCYTLASAFLQAQENFPEYTIGGSQLHPLTTTKTQYSDYLLYIKLPASYQENSKKKYPVLYITDGYWDFAFVDSLIGTMRADNLIPEIILVGIGYQGEDLSYQDLRDHDLTPYKVPDEENSGGGPAFLQFIKTEIIPYVESKFRVDDSFRALGGASLAGMFSIYALFEEPGLFQGHIAAAPPLGFAHRRLFATESLYWGEKEGDFESGKEIVRELPTRLFIGVGSHDQRWGITADVLAFNEILKRRDYVGLDYQFRLIENERHASSKIETYSWGIRFVFKEYYEKSKAKHRNL